jgi:hypothetical protein
VTKRQQRAELLRLTEAERLALAKFMGAKLLKRHRNTDENGETCYELEGMWIEARDRLTKFRMGMK